MKRKLISLAIASTLLSACTSDETPNVAPIVSVDNMIVDERTTVTLVANALDDDGTIAAFEWVQSSGTPVVLDAMNEATITFDAPDITNDEEFIFTVKVTDDDGAFATSSGLVTVIANLPPTATVENASAVERESVSLSAIADDVDGTIASYAWLQTAGESVDIIGAESSTMSFSAPALRDDTEFNFSVVVTDNDGDSVTAEASANVTEITRDFSFTGLVTDAPIPNANVQFSVAGLSLSTQAGVDGRYSIDVETDDEDDLELVRIDAQGVDEQTHILFRSYVNTPEALLEIGNALSETDVLRLNATNVTTAIAGLLDVDNDGSILTPKALDEAMSRIDLTKVMPYSAALKLIVDGTASGGTFSLPEGVENTFDFVTNPTLIDAFVSDLEFNHTADYIAAQEAILSDPELVDLDVSAEDSVGAYYFLGGNLGSGIGKVSLLANGQALYSNSDRTITATWGIQDGIVTLADVVDDAPSQTFERVSGLTLQNIINTPKNSVSKVNISLVDEYAPDTVYIQESVSTHISPDGLLSMEGLTGDFVMTGPPSIVSDASGYGFSGATLSLSLSLDGAYTYSKIGRTELDGTPVTLSGNGNVVFNENKTLATLVIEDTPFMFGLARDFNDGLYLNVIDAQSRYESVDDNGETVINNNTVSASGFVFTRQEVTLDNSTGLGNFKVVSNSTLQNTYYQFNDDETVKRIVWSDSDLDGVATEQELLVNHLFYKVDGSTILMREYRGVFYYDQEAGEVVRGNCDGQLAYENVPSDDCVPFRERTIDVITMYDDKGVAQMHLNELSIIDFNALQKQETSDPRAVNFVSESSQRWNVIDSFPFTLTGEAESQSLKHDIKTIRQSGFSVPYSVSF